MTGGEQPTDDRKETSHQHATRREAGEGRAGGRQQNETEQQRATRYCTWVGTLLLLLLLSAAVCYLKGGGVTSSYIAAAVCRLSTKPGSTFHNVLTAIQPTDKQPRKQQSQAAHPKSSTGSCRVMSTRSSTSPLLTGHHVDLGVRV